MTTTTKMLYLRFSVHENRKHHGKLLYEWLMEQARAMGIPRGTAFRAIADYGRHKVMHSQHFFELAGDTSIRVDLLVTADEKDQIMRLVEAENLKIPFTVLPVEFGVTNDDH